jgi:hypothetical protein
VLLQEENFYNGFVFVLIVCSGIDLLQKITGLATILSHEAGCITDEEFSAFIAEFSSRDMSVVTVFVQFCEDFFKGTCDKIIDSDIVGSEEEDGVGG